MACSICSHLECALEVRHSEYLKACSATLRRVSLKFAAYDLVEMERARSELQMHREGCASAIAKAAVQHSLAAANRPLFSTALTLHPPHPR